jgi:hypothetical protein
MLEMKLVKDLTGRLRQRPHYEPAELDFECEQIITTFLRDKHGAVSYPVSTEDLWVLLGLETGDVDPYADLRSEGTHVEGVTDFFKTELPRVRIAGDLSNDRRRENRLRTTITHEYGHVKFHAPLWRVEAETLPLLGIASGPGAAARCKRDTILGSTPKDWMEWQAGYVCGAILMPVTAMRALITEVIRTLPGVLRQDDPKARRITEVVTSRFAVSEEAALVRLAKLGYVAGDRAVLTLPI